MNRLNPDALALLDLLCEQFPKAFARHEARRRPLKVGIRHDLLAALDGAVTPVELARALRIYCGDKVYRSQLRADATRFDLNGEPAGEVTPEEAAPEFAGTPMPPPPIKRMSLNHLREAAQRRKQA